MNAQAREEYDAELVKFSNTQPLLLSLLYDLDLLPEQVPGIDSKERQRMRVIIAHWLLAFDEKGKQP